MQRWQGVGGPVVQCGWSRKAPEKVTSELTLRDGEEPATERAKRRGFKVEVIKGCCGLNCIPPPHKTYAAVLTPQTYQHDLIWK